jgi:hypothetical protein
MVALKIYFFAKKAFPPSFRQEIFDCRRPEMLSPVARHTPEILMFRQSEPCWVMYMRKILERELRSILV